MFSKPITWLALSAAAAVAAIAFAAWSLTSPKPTTASPAVPSGLAADIVIPPKSQAAPDFALTDQNGQTVTVSGLKGKVVAMTFLDSHCKQLCPIEGDQLSQTQRALGGKTPMTLLVVSVAPATDTPDSERAFAATHHWTGDWHWVSGTPDQLALVWKAYSIAVQNSPDNILHSSVVYLIDPDGFERAGWAAGLQPALLVHDVRLLNSQT
ncbi:MAG: SCO family protein [Chloroflexi bacterium]|nr:MAG: SCO family protein [Chloroflexota bacterium]TME48434.1 MAG: SCO family protein [Chloroflexota bacterium]